MLFLGLVPSAQLMAQVPTYTGSAIISSFVPSAVNASGQMAGYIYVSAPTGSGGSLHAALYSGGVITDLGVLPGGNQSEATGINARGDVVGGSTTGSSVGHAFLYSGGVMKDLGTLPGGATSNAMAINDAGQITGWSDTLQPNTTWPAPDHAFIYSAGVMKDLGNISGSGAFVNFSRGYAINASGQVVGWSINDNQETHAFLYSGGHMSDLGTLGGSESRARGINDSGTVVGWSYTSGDAATHAFQFKAGAGMTDLAALSGNVDSTAAAINKDGQIVGSSAFSGTPGAFIYTDSTGMVKLDTHVSGAGWNLSGASAISSAGQIIASGSNATRDANYFLLTPPAATTISVNLVQGWNLIGNGNDAPLTVATAFGNTNNVTTVWKWVASKSIWAFYTPTQNDGGHAYATSKGYDFLTAINGGEGFWVNAKTAFTAQLPAGTAITSTSFQTMPSGWNLIAIGDGKTPSQFSAVTPLTTLWAWDAVQANWYFYAPSLEAKGGTALTDYITSKGYLNFGTKVLDPTTGFWVNKP